MRIILTAMVFFCGVSGATNPSSNLVDACRSALGDYLAPTEERSWTAWDLRRVDLADRKQATLLLRVPAYRAQAIKIPDGITVLKQFQSYTKDNMYHVMVSGSTNRLGFIGLPANSEFQIVTSSAISNVFKYAVKGIQLYRIPKGTRDEEINNRFQTVRRGLKVEDLVSSQIFYIYPTSHLRRFSAKALQSYGIEPQDFTGANLIEHLRALGPALNTRALDIAWDELRVVSAPAHKILMQLDSKKLPAAPSATDEIPLTLLQLVKECLAEGCAPNKGIEAVPEPEKIPVGTVALKATPTKVQKAFGIPYSTPLSPDYDLIDAEQIADYIRSVASLTTVRLSLADALNDIKRKLTAQGLTLPAQREVVARIKTMSFDETELLATSKASRARLSRILQLFAASQNLAFANSPSATELEALFKILGQFTGNRFTYVGSPKAYGITSVSRVEEHLALLLDRSIDGFSLRHGLGTILRGLPKGSLPNPSIEEAVALIFQIPDNSKPYSSSTLFQAQLSRILQLLGQAVNVPLSPTPTAAQLHALVGGLATALETSARAAEAAKQPARIRADP